MLGLIISLIVIGLIAGALARLIVPGRQEMSVLMTIVLGIIGSFVGGFLGYLIFHHDSNGWTDAAPTLPPEVNDRTLFKVWGTAANDVWVCGQAGLILHYDGASWSLMDSGTTVALYSVWGTGTGAVYAGGGVLLRYEP